MSDSTALIESCRCALLIMTAAKAPHPTRAARVPLPTASCQPKGSGHGADGRLDLLNRSREGLSLPLGS